MESTGKQSRSIRPAPPPPPTATRHQVGTTIPAVRRSHGRLRRASLPRRTGQDRRGLVVSLRSAPLPRDGSTRPRGPPLASPTNKCERRGGRSPFLSLEHSQLSLSLPVSLSSGWMDGALTFSLSLSSPLLVYLFLLPGHPSIPTHPSNPLRLLSLSLSLSQSNQVLGITQRNNSHHHHAIHQCFAGRAGGRPGQ